MDFKILTVYLLAFASVRAGFLNAGQNSGSSNGGSGGGGGAVSGGGSGSSGGNYGFRPQQVPLTLTPGPIPQQASTPHAATAITTSFNTQQPQQLSGSFSTGPAATSSSYRQQHVNSVPATITTHGVATSYVAVPVHGFFAGNNGNSGSTGGNGGISGGNNAGGPGGNYGYGGYGYSFSSAGGSGGSSGGSQGNGAGYGFNYGGNSGTLGNNGYSG